MKPLWSSYFALKTHIYVLFSMFFCRKLFCVNKNSPYNYNSEGFLICFILLPHLSSICSALPSITSTIRFSVAQVFQQGPPV